MSQAKEEHYIELLNQNFKDLFSQEKLKNPDFQQILADAIARAFHLPGKGLTKEKKTQLLLHQLFLNFSSAISSAYPFDFSQFLDQFITKKSERKTFLIAVTYSLYFNDLGLTKETYANRIENLEFLMFQLTAEHLSRKTSYDILLQLSLEKRLCLICYLFLHYREGSFHILTLLEEILNQSKAVSPKAGNLFKTLIQNLRRKYFDKKLLFNLIIHAPHIDEDFLEKVISQLHKNAAQQTHIFYARFKELIPLIINYPVRLYNELENLKIKYGGQDYQPAPKEYEKALQRQNDLKNYFQFFLDNTFTLNNFQELAQYFGLEGHRTKLQYNGKNLCEENTLVETVTKLCQIFANTAILASTKINDITAFIQYAKAIILHLEAMHFDLYKIKNELEAWTCSLATKGKDLSKLPSLPSILRGTVALIDLMNTKLSEKTILNTHPILVFDQSDPKLFAKNKRYITTLNRKYKSSIVHISKDEALALAKKIGVEGLIDTTGTGIFGYGGARNCVYLLTSVIMHAFSKGKRTILQMLEMDDKELISLFNEVVLGNDTYPGDTIFMVDDDKEVAVPIIFTQLLFSTQTQKKYSALVSYQYGRDTFQNWYFSLYDVPIVKDYKMIFRKWESRVYKATISDYGGKPRICINVPMGSEETHFFRLLEHSYLMQPSAHMPGMRYISKDLWPTYWFVGIHQSIKKYNPYYMQLGVIDDILDPLGIHGIPVPWNDKDNENQLTNLRNLFHFIADEKIKKNMQKDFWKKLDNFINTDLMVKSPLHKDIRYLINLNVDEAIAGLQFKEKLTGIEKKSLSDLGEIFKAFKQDALIFWDFARLVIEAIKSPMPSSEKPWYEECIDRGIDLTSLIENSKKSIEGKFGIDLHDYPLSIGLYRILIAIGAAHFNQEIEKVLKYVESMRK